MGAIRTSEKVSRRTEKLDAGLRDSSHNSSRSSVLSEIAYADADSQPKLPGRTSLKTAIGPISV